MIFDACHTIISFIRSLKPKYHIDSFSLCEFICVMRYFARMDQGIILNRIYIDYFIKDNLISLSRGLKANIYSVGAVISMQFKSLMSFVVGYGKACKKFRKFIFEFVLFEVLRIVLVKYISYFFIEFIDIFNGHRVDRSILVEIVDTCIFCVFYFL